MTSVFIPRIGTRPLDELTSIINNTIHPESELSPAAPTAVYDYVLGNLPTIAESEYSHDILSLTLHNILYDENNDNIILYVPKYVQALAAAAEFPLDLRIELVTFSFNHLNETSALRYEVFLSLLQLYASSPSPNNIFILFSQLDTFVPHWAIPKHDEAALYAQVYAIAKQFSSAYEARKYLGKSLVLYAQSDESSGANATHCAITAVVTSLTLNPSQVSLCHHIGYDVLLENQVVQHLRTLSDYAPLISLLELYCNGTIAQYDEFVQDQEHVAHITSKFPTINLTTAREHVTALNLADVLKPGQSYNYKDIATKLQLQDATLIEEYLVDAMTIGQIAGKLDELNETIAIHRVVPRKYDSSLWATMRERLGIWQGIVERVAKQHQQHLDV